MESSTLIDALRKRNPAHDGPLGAAHWALVDDAVTGQGGFLAGLRDLRVYDHGPRGTVGASGSRLADGSTYLVQFARETAEDFAARVRATTYDNHVAPVARTYTGQLWATAPLRETRVDAVQAFWSDPDEGLGKVDAWMAAGSDAALRHGFAVCLIDRPEGERPATSPGTVGRWLDPRELVDWQTDDRGRFVWARLGSETCERDPLTGAETEREVYTLWTRETWRRITLVRKDGQWSVGEDTDVKPHTLGMVPLAVLRWVPTMQPRDLCAASVLSGSVAAAVELFNVRSEQRAIERDCVFPILCIQTDDATAVQGTKVGTQSGLTYPGGAAQPGFIAPDASVTIHYGTRTEELTTRIYEAAYQDRPSAASVAPESGVARAYRFRQMSALLGVAAQEHEGFERDVIQILAALDGADASEWQAVTTITYPRRFDPLDAETRADTAMAVLKDADKLVPEVVAAARADIASALYPRMAPDAEKRLRAQLDQRAEFERAQYVQQFDLAKLNEAPAPSNVELNSFSTPYMTGNEVRAQIGLPPSTDPLADTIPAMEELRSKIAQQAAEAALNGTDAAMTAAVSDLPAPAPGEVVPSIAGPTAGDTTPEGE